MYLLAVTGLHDFGYRTVCRVFDLRQQWNNGIVCTGSFADCDRVLICVQRIGIHMGIYAVIQVRNPRGDTDFCLAGCHGQTHAAKVTAGWRVRQIVVQIFSDLRKIRCRDIGFSGFRCGR